MGKRSIRTRLLILMLIPALALLVLTAVQLDDTRRLAQATGQFETLVSLSDLHLTVLHNLQVERSRTIEARFVEPRGDEARVAVLADAREATDRSIEQVRGAADVDSLAAIDESVATAHATSLASFERFVGVRQPIDGLTGSSAEVTAPFTQPIDAVIEVERTIAPLLGDPEIQASQQAASAAARLKGTVIDRGDLLLLATVGQVDRTSGTRQIGQLASQQLLWLETVERVSDDAAVDQLREVATIDPTQETARVVNGLLSGMLPPADVLAENTAQQADELRAIELDFAAATARTAEALRSEANRQLLVLALVTAAALAFTLLVLTSVRRSIIAPLQRLTELAQRIGLSLPDTVEQVAAGAESPDSEFAEPVNADLVRRPDELGDLARAIRASTETAVLVATDQARTRAGVAKTIVDVARREQSLVEQQLALLDRLEDDESNPQQLANLFGLDHLATRMRRNAENLLLFASGELPGSPTDQPMALVDVVRGAAAEIEEYTRVDVNVGLSSTVIGYAATPVSHLLAELIENATQYSPPHSRVQITARAASEGVTLTIRDHGIGMSEEELAAAQQKLAETPLLEAAESRRLGLYVVGLLSARLGITVTLSTPPDGSGTLVEVMLPDALFTELPAGQRSPATPGPITTPGPAAPASATARQMATVDHQLWQQAGPAAEPRTPSDQQTAAAHLLADLPTDLPVRNDSARPAVPSGPAPFPLTDDELPPIPSGTAEPTRAAAPTALPTRSLGAQSTTPDAGGDNGFRPLPGRPLQARSADPTTSAGLSLAKESAGGLIDLDPDLLGGFFSVGDRTAAGSTDDDERDAVEDTPVAETQSLGPPPQTQAFSAPSWATPPGGRR